MGRGAGRGRGAQTSQKQKVKEEGDSAASQVAAADSQQDLAGVNADHYSKVQSALHTIESVVSDIKELPPCSLTDGGGMQPYSSKVFKQKLGLQEDYLCDHNLFLTNPLRDASPGFDCVPASNPYPPPANPSGCQPGSQPATQPRPESTQPISTCEASPSTLPR